LDDGWIRDSGPLFVRLVSGGEAAIDFEFNSWGEKYQPYEADRRLGERLCEALGVQRIAGPMVLEGGAISVDGTGTLVTTAECLLNPSRNPGMSQTDMEAVLRRFLGAERVIWLPFGLLEDSDTDGHVDNVASFVAPGVIVCQQTDRANPNFERLRANLDVLRSARTISGERLVIETVDVLPYVGRGRWGGSQPCPYINWYIANGTVIVPVGDPERATEDLDSLAAYFPGREIVGTPAQVMTYGGGGVHCVTMQRPAHDPYGSTAG